jgi:hypothetical protein
MVLSDEQIADLRAGRGMALALTAELNGYPGPLHVLDLADQLALTATQAMLRAAHLKYHLAVVLTADKLERYTTLRGYR